MPALEEIVINAVKKHTATLIVLHGLGDSGAGWSFLAENWRRRNKFESLRFVFPSAAPIPITVNGGMRMPGWYDITNFDTLNRSDDEAGVMASRTYIHDLIQAEIAAGIPAKRIILGGFSQGGAMSLFSGLTFSETLAGVFGLSCYQLMEPKFVALREQTGKQMPKVFMGHGEADPLVKFEWGARTKDALVEKGLDVEWHSYRNVPHSASPQEIDDLEKWVKARLDEGEAESAL